MHVLGIMGSPRRESNTDILLDRALAGATDAGAKTEKLLISQVNIRPCMELYHCAVDGTCSIHDDMREVYDSLVAADAVILASPIFFYGLTSQVKALVDRCQALWVRRYVLKTWAPESGRRHGAFIAVGATHGAKLFDGVKLTARYFFDAVGMDYAEELLVRGVDAKGEVQDHPSALDGAYELGKRLVAGVITSGEGAWRG
ncbi:flavodoxin family protein [Candidatus Bipolaricaulota bacterium]|nr:flavodoxin family protein [Candidatus Bipolaricaulota bacterium]